MQRPPVRPEPSVSCLCRYRDHPHELKGNNDLLVETRPDVIAGRHPCPAAPSFSAEPLLTVMGLAKLQGNLAGLHGRLAGLSRPGEDVPGRSATAERC